MFIFSLSIFEIVVNCQAMMEELKAQNLKYQKQMEFGGGETSAVSADVLQKTKELEAELEIKKRKEQEMALKAAHAEKEAQTLKDKLKQQNSEKEKVFATWKF